MKYSQELIEQIRDKADILNIIGAHLDIKKRGSSFVCLCPFHNDSKPSMYIHPQKQIYKCFACGAGGDVYAFLMEYENKTFPDAIQFLAEKYHVLLPKREYHQFRYQDQYIYLKDINKLAQKIYHQYLFKHKGGKIGRNYLNKRGIGKKTCVKFQIGYAPNGYQFTYNFLKDKYELKQLLATGLFYQKPGSQPIDFFRGRIIFPIFNDKSETVGFGGRLTGPGEPKYLNTTDTVLFKKSTLLYGFNLIYNQILKSKTVFIAEGYLDVIACQNRGIPAVAPLGTTLSHEQIRKLKRYCQSIYLIFDGDEAGRKAALRSSLLLMETSSDGEVVLLPKGLDPFEYFKTKKEEDFQDLIEKEKINIHDFFVNENIKETNLSPTKKREVAVKLIRDLKNVKDEIILLELKKKIAERLNLKDVDKFVKLFSQWEKEISKSKFSPKRNILESRPRKRNKMEMNFVLFLCGFPNFIFRASVILSTEDFEDRVAAFIYAHLLRLRKKQDIKFHDVLELFKDQKMKDYLIDYVLKKSDPLEEKSNDKAFQDYLCKVKMNIIDRFLSRLQKKIGLAEATGDFDLVTKLMEKAHLKQIEKDNLNQQFRA